MPKEVASMLEKNPECGFSKSVSSSTVIDNGQRKRNTVERWTMRCPGQTPVRKGRERVRQRDGLHLLWSMLQCG